MDIHTNKGLAKRLGVATLGALALGAAAFSMTAPAQAAMSAAPLGKGASSAIHRVSDRCQRGFHEINAPNGNGYRCVANRD